MGRTPADIMADLTDEALLELLAMADPYERRYELNVVLTEAKNRVHRLRMAASAPGAGDAEAGV
jgi:hypothetical protein